MTSLYVVSAKNGIIFEMLDAGQVSQHFHKIMSIAYEESLNEGCQVQVTVARNGEIERTILVSSPVIEE